MHRTVDVAVVRHGGGGLAQLAEVRGQLVHVTGTIQQAVVRVEMEMGEVSGHALILGCTRRATQALTREEKAYQTRF